MLYTVWLTYDCNLRCTYCYESEEKKKKDMSMETVQKVLSYIKKRSEDVNDKNVQIAIHGGEPLMNYEVLCYLIENLKKWRKDIWINMTTNATLITEKNIQFITDNINEISISIDGIEKVHDSNRIYKNGEGSFKTVVKNLKMLFERKDNLIARMTVTHDTVKDLYESIVYLHGLGFRTISSIVDQYDAGWNKDNMDILEQQMLKLAEYCNEHKDMQAGILNNIKYRKKSKCCPGDMTMNISPEGDFYPCAYVTGNDRFNMGNVITGIDTDKLQEIKDINNEEIENCMECSWKEYCSGYRCKLFNYAVSGEFAPSPLACCLEHTFLDVYKKSSI